MTQLSPLFTQYARATRAIEEVSANLTTVRGLPASTIDYFNLLAVATDIGLPQHSTDTRDQILTLAILERQTSRYYMQAMHDARTNGTQGFDYSILRKNWTATYGAEVAEALSTLMASPVQQLPQEHPFAVVHNIIVIARTAASPTPNQAPKP